MHRKHLSQRHNMPTEYQSNPMQSNAFRRAQLVLFARIFKLSTSNITVNNKIEMTAS